MKKIKIISILITIFISIISLVGCSNNEKTLYNVSFDYGYNYKVESVFCKEGSTINPPKIEDREGFKFLYWAEGTKEFNFENPINKDTILVAVWEELKPVYIVINGKPNQIYIEKKDSYELSDFNIINDNASLVGFYRINNNQVQNVDLSKGLNENETLYADFMTEGLILNKISGKEEISVDGYNGINENIVIPTFYRGLPVTTINKRSMQTKINTITFGKNISTFMDESFAQSIIDEIVVPNSVKTIGDSAFAYASINKITFEENSQMSSLGKGAFFKVSELSEIILPRGISSIYEYTFSWCENLEKIYIPNTVTLLENNIFISSQKMNIIYRQIKDQSIQEQNGYMDGLSWNIINPNDSRKIKVQYVIDEFHIA